MAKKQISNYKFVPGIIPPAFDQYPNAVALIQANKPYIIQEIMGYMTFATNTPSYAPVAETAAPYAIASLTANKTFIQEEAAAWIDRQVELNIPPFAAYTYNITKRNKCKRDIGYLIDAFITDLTGGGNAETIRIGRMFFLNDTAQLLDPDAEAAAHTFVQGLINNYVLPANPYATQQAVAAQTIGTPAEDAAVIKVSGLNDIIINLITDGLSSLPAISYNYNSLFAQVMFGATKCKRDIAYVLDAVATDIVLGTNYNSIFVGLAESNSHDLSQSVIDAINASETQVLALSAVSSVPTISTTVGTSYNEILTVAQGGYAAASAVTFTGTGDANADRIAAKDRLVNNRAFIQAEINAWVNVNYPDHNHDTVKCSRDIGFAVDALTYDVLYGGNSATYDSAKFFYYGGASGITVEHKAQTVAAYGRLKAIVSDIVTGATVSKSAGNALVQNTSGSNATSSEGATLQDLAQAIADVVDGGLLSLPASRSVPGLSGATSDNLAARNAIVAASTAIQNAVVTYSDYTYDAAKCERDSEYVVDSYLYDMTYGGNSMSYYVGSKYYFTGVAQVNQPQVEVEVQTFARDMIVNYILQNKYHPSYQWSTYQVVDTQYTSETTADEKLIELSDTIINAIDGGLTALPAVVAPDSQNGGLLPNAVALIDANKKFIQEETIAYIAYNVANNIVPFVYYTYNAEKCRRDVSYVIDGYISDLKHGGNRQTYFNASKYFEGGVAQVDGDRAPEISAHTFIRSLIDNFILDKVAYTPKQIVVSQVLTGGNSEPFAKTRIKELTNTVLDVIAGGLEYLPTRVSNRGYVKMPGYYKLKDFLLITNVNRSQILFNFADPSSAAEVTYTEDYDSDFPAALYGTDKVTTITFDVDTSSHMVTDSIQIFVESKNQEVRLNSSATDAMERMKVGIPQSMLDADFEYGLQPTKWQALAMMRNYPAIYEIPGSDLAVVSVVTDASTGTSGVGASSITVTTVSSHGYAVGDPFTIKALANTVSGFSRAEGSFLVATVPSSNTFTYYAKSKVGSSNGQVLATNYTQLRRGQYYTNAAVGNPSFSVYSSGASGSVTTSLITPAGSDVIGFSGSPPPVGSPLSGTGLTTGSQVTAVTGSGGVAASTKLAVQADIGDTSLNVVSTTGISQGLVFDRGDGVAVVVTGVAGQIVSLSGTLTSPILGIAESYTGVLQDASSTTSGTGAVFTVSRNDTTYTSVATSPGSGYVANDTIVILGTDLGGATPDNDATLTVASASVRHIVATFNNATLTAGSGYVDGTAVATTATKTSVATFGTIVPGTGYSDTTGVVTTGGTGTGLTVDIVTDGLGAVVTVTVNNPGSGYTVGDVIALSSGNNDATAQIATLVASSGTGLTVDVTTNGSGLVTAVAVNNGGHDYAVGDRITIVDGDGLSTIIVATVTLGGLITSVTAAGTPITAPTEDFISAFTISESTLSQIANGNTGLSYSAIATLQVAFASNHGLVPGDTITVQITSAGTGAQLAAGAYFVEQVPTPNIIRYTARAPGAIDNTLVGYLYARPDSFFVHRPFDGGVQLGTASPSHGATAIRMSKKYIRYQSGKGVMYNTGALFAPSYDIRSLTANGTAVGSVITITTDDTDHGCQIGGGITISGVETAGYDGEYVVTDVVNERVLRVIAQKTLAATSAVIGSPCILSIRKWHGSTIRSGIFDDQNGMFWQYDGIRMGLCRRSSTFQIAGTISIAANSNLVTGSNTRFTSQLAQGDRIVIRGMTHIVGKIDSDTSMTVTPDYRGVNDVAGAKCAKTIDLLIPQEQWNLDPLNGSGPSGYNLDVTKMQMIGIQHTWYGAGFVDFMLRGPEGNYVWAHRFRNSNVNTEAYMRTGNQPVRYEVINEGAKGRLTANMTNSQTFVPLTADACYWFPDSGTVLIDNELIRYTGRTTTQLTGCVRSAPLTQFVAGSQRNFTAGSAATHAVDAGVILVSNTITPNISHWGSAFMIDGQFDSDRGYIFNYAATALSASVDKTTAFLIRLAPSVSNAQIGDLGDKELLNRAQLLLSSIAITSETVSGGGAIVIEGVLNPSNYPTDPTKITWTGLASSAAGGQPSFAQIAAGGSVTWSGNSYTTTATVQGAFTTTLTAKSFNLITASLTATSFNAVTQNIAAQSFSPASNATYNNALSSGRNDFLVSQADLTTLNNSTTVQAGDSLTVVGNGSTITSVRITGLAGQISFTSANTLYIGETVTITGTISNTAFSLANLNITGTGGQFSCNAASQTLYVGQTITISGTITGGGTIVGYVSPTTYQISATNGSTTFTIQTLAGGAVTTTTGNANGGTFSVQPPSITGYASGTQYRIAATNGTSTATLTTIGGAALTTSGGVPTGITTTVNTFIANTTITSVVQNYITINSVSYARIVMAANPVLTSNAAVTDAQYNVSVRITSSLAARYNTAISNARTDFLIPQTQYAATTIAVADVLSATTYVTGGQTVSTSTANYCRIGGTLYAQIVMTGNGSASSVAGAGNNVTVTITNSVSNTYNRAMNTGRLDFLVTDTEYDASGIQLSDVLSVATYITGGQTISSVTRSYLNISGTNYTRIVMSAVPNAQSNTGSGNDITVTVTAAGTAASYNKTNYLFFTSASWLSSGATQGTRIATSYTQFPAGTAVTTVATRVLGGNTIYRITFTQTSNTTINASATPTFQFGALYALPGEQVFSFIANPGESGELSLEALKELTATAIGGRGTFPNGPDVLAINIYKVSGTATTANLILRWGEAQA